jgi:hypothetical protein
MVCAQWQADEKFQAMLPGDQEEWLHNNCRRHIPDGVTVWARLEAVMADFSGVRDTLGASLFTQDTWNVFNRHKPFVCDADMLSGAFNFFAQSAPDAGNMAR